MRSILVTILAIGLTSFLGLLIILGPIHMATCGGGWHRGWSRSDGQTCGLCSSAGGCHCGMHDDKAGMGMGSMPASGPATQATTTNATGTPEAGTQGRNSDSAAIPAAPTAPTAAATPGAPAQ